MPESVMPEPEPIDDEAREEDVHVFDPEMRAAILRGKAAIEGGDMGRPVGELFDSLLARLKTDAGAGEVSAS